MALSNVSGFPRIGRNRELKFATEGYWRGETSADELAATAKAIRVENWKLMQDAGIDLIPSNDFSYYDQVLDTIALVGAVPERYGWEGGEVDLDTYFAMARGRQTDDQDVTAMEMTKWFDTNYHYIVPELGPDTRFSLSSSKPFDEHAEAMEELGIDTVPVLIGPVSFLLLSKPAEGVRALRRRRSDRAAGRGLRRGDRAARRAGRDLGAVRRALLRRGPLGEGARCAPPRLRGALQGP